MARRFELTDEQWVRIEHLLLGRPERFGDWNATFQRFKRWAKSGVWARVMAALGEDADLECPRIDSTVIRGHQHAAGAKKKR